MATDVLPDVLERWRAARQELAAATAWAVWLRYEPLEGTRHSDAAKRLRAAEEAESDARWHVERWLDGSDGD